MKNPYFVRNKKLKDEYPKAYMEWSMNDTLFNGYTPVKFHYNTSFQGKVTEAMMQELRLLGFNKRELSQIFSKKFKMLPQLFEKLLNGERVLGVWELPHLLKYAGLTISIKPSRQNYSYKIEGKNKELLLIVSRVPFFFIVINTENLYDFRVDFSLEEHLKYLKPHDKTVDRYFKFVRKALHWYFIKLQQKEKYPFDMKHFKALFLIKFKNNETRHYSVDKKPETPKLDVDMEVIEAMAEELNGKDFYTITNSKEEI